MTDKIKTGARVAPPKRPRGSKNPPARSQNRPCGAFSGSGPGSPPSRPKAAVYIRISTATQSGENQRPELDQLVRARGLYVVGTYLEQASAAKIRPEFDRMFHDARRGAFSVLVVWALDRFGRSMVGNLNAVLELDRIGVQVVSAREPWLDTGGPVRSLLVAIFSWVAEQERTRLGERTRAGLERARARGRTLGRPRRAFTVLELVHARASVRDGVSLRAVARQLRVPISTLHRALAAGDVPKKVASPTTPK